MIVRRACAWCGTTMGLIASDTMTKATHGACQPCADGWRVQFTQQRENKVGGV